MERILLPVDGTSSSTEAVEELIRMGYKDKESELHLLNVQYPLNFDQDAIPPVRPPILTPDRQERGLRELQQARDLLDQAGIPYEYHIVVGEPAHQILAFAQQHRFDRIVMGSRKKGKFSGMLLGSVSAEVAYKTKIPVELLSKSQWKLTAKDKV